MKGWRRIGRAKNNPPFRPARPHRTKSRSGAKCPVPVIGIHPSSYRSSPKYVSRQGKPSVLASLSAARRWILIARIDARLTRHRSLSPYLPPPPSLSLSVSLLLVSPRKRIAVREPAISLAFRRRSLSSVIQFAITLASFPQMGAAVPSNSLRVPFSGLSCPSGPRTHRRLPPRVRNCRGTVTKRF
jgi:hypothetical protein